MANSPSKKDSLKGLRPFILNSSPSPSQGGGGVPAQPAKKAKPGFFYGYVVALASFGIWMIGWGTSNSFGLFFKPILTEFGWSRATTAGAYSLSCFVRGLLGIVTGRLTDRFGPRTVVLIFGSFLGIAYLLMSQIKSVWHYYIVYGLLTAIGLSIATTPIMVTIARWFVKRRGLMIGIVQSGASIGATIMAPLVGWLILTYGWRLSFVFLGVIALVFIALSGLFLKRDPREVNQVAYGATDEKVQQVVERGTGLQTSGFSLRQAIATRQFWMLWAMFFAFGFCRSTTLAHVAAYVTDLGFSLTIAASVLAVISASGFVGRIGMGRLCDLIGNRTALIINYGLMAAVLLETIIAGELWTLYLFAAVFGFSWGGMATIRIPILAEVFGLGSLGTILGFVELGADIGATVGPFLAGWIFDLSNSYLPTFIIAASLSAIALILTVILRPVGSKRAELRYRPGA